MGGRHEGGSRVQAELTCKSCAPATRSQLCRIFLRCVAMCVRIETTQDDLFAFYHRSMDGLRKDHDPFACSRCMHRCSGGFRSPQGAGGPGRLTWGAAQMPPTTGRSATGLGRHGRGAAGSSSLAQTPSRIPSYITADIPLKCYYNRYML